jgi:hypothetical protein
MGSYIDQRKTSKEKSAFCCQVRKEENRHRLMSLKRVINSIRSEETTKETIIKEKIAKYGILK